MIPLVSIVVVFAFIVLIIAAAITLQFVDLAIVVDDAGAVDGIERSYEVAIANLGAVIGYVLFELLFVLLITAPFLVLWFDDGFTTATPTVQPTPALVGALVVAALGSTVLQTYRVTFYRALSNRT
uniref:DUF7847 domain-containing protein n=1 Tax=Halorussus halophilus TaxID=2650975 RepID=UPI0013018928|nr:hypothetical protein [Halorussus halophilus]